MLAAQPGQHVGQVLGPEHLEALDQARLDGGGRGHHHALHPEPPGREQRRQDPAHARAPARRAPARRRSTTPRSPASGTAPAAASTEHASARSYPLPCFGSVAGERASVMRRAGQVSPEFTTAARTRSRDSASAASGSPTSDTPGRPWPMSASISTTSPSTPRSPIDHAHASATSERPLVVLELRRPRPAARSTARTSKRTSANPQPPAACLSASQRCARRRMRAALACVTASAGRP